MNIKTICFYILIFALLLGACSGQGGYNPSIYSEDENYTVAEDYYEPEAQNISTAEEAVKTQYYVSNTALTAKPWQYAYAEILRNYYKNVPPPDEWLNWAFFLRDIDGDGIPELFIVYIASGVWSEAIYTFVDGNIVPIEGSFFAYYGIYPTVDRPGLIIQAYGRTELMILEDGKFVTELTLRQPFLPGDYERWYINDFEVGEGEFFEVYNGLIPDWDGNWENSRNIWPDAISEDNIREIVFGWMSEPIEHMATVSEILPVNEPFLPLQYVSPFGRQVAEEFLCEFTSIFTGVGQVVVYWDGQISVHTGEFWDGWDEETQQPIKAYVTPEIYRGPTETGEWGFFDRLGNRIYDATWLYVSRGEGWTSYHYAGYFRLFDFDNSGIPVIFIHFNQTFEGGYAGFYRIFRFIDGEYRMLEMRAFKNGEELPWWQSWIGSLHELFFDDTGRIISFVGSMYHNMHKYEHLVLTDKYAELHFITGLEDNWDDWETWEEYHWIKSGAITEYRWGVVDSWAHHNPYMFGTYIPLTLISPLTKLQEKITASILEKR